MAKCMKMKKSKEVVRVSNSEAKQLYESGKAEYTNKDEYARYLNGNGKEQSK